MNIVGDTHTHTLVCGHAYSTLEENIASAKAQGHRFLAYTEHSPSMIKSIPPWYFGGMSRTIPRVVNDVVLVFGCEADVLNEEGELGLEERYLQKLDWVIASIHGAFAGTEPGSRACYTRAWENVAANPMVDVIGHLGNPRVQPDYEKVIKAFKAGDKIVELNCSSHITRQGSEENCIRIAQLCVEYGVPMVLSSDAHFSAHVGDVAWGLDLIERLQIPEELVLNLDYERFRKELFRRKGVELPE